MNELVALIVWIILPGSRFTVHLTSSTSSWCRMAVALRAIAMCILGLSSSHSATEGGTGRYGILESGGARPDRKRGVVSRRESSQPTCSEGEGASCEGASAKKRRMHLDCSNSGFRVNSIPTCVTRLFMRAV